MADREVLGREAGQVQQWLAGTEDGVTRQGSFPEAGTAWYLLSTRWFSLWRQYVGLEAITDLRTGESPVPAVDNSDLIQDHDGQPGFLRSIHDNSIYDRPLKRSLEAQRDFLILPSVAWEFLTEKYGVEPESELKRYSRALPDAETQIEVNFRPVSVVFIPPAVKSVRIDRAKTAFFSRAEPLDRVAKRLKGIYNIRYPTIQIDSVRMWKLTPGTSEKDLETALNDNTGRFRLFPGSLLDEGQRLEEAEFSFTDTLVFEVRRSLAEWQFTALHDMLCSKCRARIGLDGISCPCQKVYFCNDRCKAASGHICEHYSPPTDVKKCPFDNEILGNQYYTCTCGQVIGRQFSYCESQCMQRHSHRCGRTESKDKCRNCSNLLPATAFPCYCNKYKYCSLLCKNSDKHDNCTAGKKCNFCRNALSTKYKCRCGTVLPT